VNGDSFTNSISNTDRGAYFGNGNYKFTFPSNNKVSFAFTLPTSLIIASWILGFDTYERLYTRYKDSSNQFYVSLDNAFDKYLGSYF